MRLRPFRGTFPTVGIDCSGDLCSVAVVTEQGVEERSAAQPGGQLRLLFPMFMALLADVDIRPHDLKRIGVSVGPGSFAGLRLALTTVRTMAQILDCPVVGVGTLDAIGLGLLEWAQGTYGHTSPPRICVVTDARKGQIFCACYDVRDDDGLSRVGDYQVLDPDVAIEWLDRHIAADTVVGGTALRAYGDMLRSGVSHWSQDVLEAPDSVAMPHARHVARAASGLYGDVTLVQYMELLPLYLRPPDVKKPRLRPSMSRFQAH